MAKDSEKTGRRSSILRWPWGRRRVATSDGNDGAVHEPAVEVTPGADGSRWAEVRGLRLHYRVSGRRGGTPVVVLHGLMGHAREWDAAIDLLAPDHEIWALDQRGHGRSDWAEDYARSTMAEDLIAWLEATGLQDPVVMGHSMGGTVALLAAARRPELFGRLVIVDVAPTPAQGDLQAWLREYLEELGSASYATVEEALAVRSGGPRARPELVRRFVEHNLDRGEDGRLRWRFDARGLVGSLDSISVPALWEATDAVRCPVLLLRGEHSLELPVDLADQMVRRLGEARLGTVTGAGHDVAQEQPEQVAQAVREFASGA
ncbi:MAG TPA: alpha/beta hydrolase [Citricoccus sp.]